MQKGRRIRRPFCLEFSRRDGSSRIHQTNPMEPLKPRNIANRLSLTAGQCKFVRRNFMTNRWMITAAAAALIAGSGFAYAQGNMGHESGAAGGAGMHQGSPSSPGTSSHEREGSAGMKSSQSEQKGGATNRSAQQEKKGAEKSTVGQSPSQENKAQESNKSDRTKGMSSQTEEKGGAKGMSSQNEEKGAAGKKAEERNERSGNMKAEERNERGGNKNAEERNERGNMRSEGQERNGNMNAQGRTNNSTAEGNRSQTTGQAGARAKLSTEQRTKITTVIRGEHVAPATNINFPVTVGTRVPREVGFHPLPADVVTVYPEWRGYEFFLARDEIVVVDPRTLEI